MVRGFEKIIGYIHFGPQKDTILVIIEELMGISWKDRRQWLEMQICEFEIMEALLLFLFGSQVVSDSFVTTGPLQYSCLENPMDGGAWWAAVHGVTKSQTRLSDFTFTFHFSLSCIGEGNGNPLQCSCLENPRDGGAWWLPSRGSHRVEHD